MVYMKAIGLKPCPNCNSMPNLKKAKCKVYFECDGDCRTQTHKHCSVFEAAEEWNNLQPSNHEQEVTNGLDQH